MVLPSKLGLEINRRWYSFSPCTKLILSPTRVPTVGTAWSSLALSTAVISTISPCCNSPKCPKATALPPRLVVVMLTPSGRVLFTSDMVLPKISGFSTRTAHTRNEVRSSSVYLGLKKLLYKPITKMGTATPNG